MKHFKNPSSTFLRPVELWTAHNASLRDQACLLPKGKPGVHTSNTINPCRLLVVYTPKGYIPVSNISRLCTGSTSHRQENHPELWFHGPGRTII